MKNALFQVGTNPLYRFVGHSRDVQEMICRGLKDVTRRWARLCPTTHDEGLVVARLAAALVCPSPPTNASSARTPSSLLYEDTLPSVLYGKFFGGYERLVEPSQAVPPRGTYNGTILRKLNEACTSIRASCATSSRHSPPSDQNATDADTSTYADQLTRRLLCVVGISPHTALSSPPVLRAYLSDLTSHSSLRAADDIKAPSPNAVPCPCVALTLNVKVKNVKPTPFVALEKAEVMVSCGDRLPCVTVCCLTGRALGDLANPRGSSG